jgi:hypothetical protein
MKQTICSGVLAIAVLTGCRGHQKQQQQQERLDLEPALAANPVGGTGDAAVDTAAGVRVQARADAWQWSPDLGGKSTPMLVRSENTGKTPVLVRYNRLRITGASGQVYSAMPPFVVSAAPVESLTVRAPVYSSAGFGVAPYLRLYYPGLTPYDGPFAYDSIYYERYLPAYRRLHLPSAEMVQRALPEGVLGPGGSVSGFVFFEPISHEVMPRLEFSFDVVNPDSNQQLGKATIPFVIRVR